MIKRDPKYAGFDQNKMDQMDFVRRVLLNMPLSAPGLAIGTGSAAKVKIVNTTTFLSDGVFKSKAANAEVAFTATTMDIAANASTVQEACYLVMLAADGTPSLVMGAIASGAGNALLPELPDTGTCIGYVRIAIAAGATPFDASTDLLSAGHITDTYYDAMVMPKFSAAQ
jgi:hypothetical protein